MQKGKRFLNSVAFAKNHKLWTRDESFEWNIDFWELDLYCEAMIRAI